MKIILNNPVINIYRIQASKDDVPVRDSVDHTNLSRGFVFKEDESMDELKTRNDGVFICTESKELFPPSEWDGGKGKAIGVAIIEGEKRLLVALNGSDKDLELLGIGKDSGIEGYSTVSKAKKDTDGRKNTEALLKAGSEAAKFCKEWGEEWHIPHLKRQVGNRYMTDGIGLAHASLITIFLFSTGTMVSGAATIRTSIIGCVLFPAF